MNDQNDPEIDLDSFMFGASETPGGPGSEDQGQDEDPTDSFYSGFDRKIIVQQPSLPSDSPLDLSSELSAEDTEQIALATALIENQKDSKPPQQRKGYHSNPIVGLTDERSMVEFLNKTRRVTVEKLQDHVVNESMPLMLWKLREFALQGKYTETRAVEIWLTWASKIAAARPKRTENDKKALGNGALFDATLTTGQILDAQAKAVSAEPPAEPKPRSGNFSTAGNFIGKLKSPNAGKPRKRKKGGKK